jgi:hypothetical protein
MSGKVYMRIGIPIADGSGAQNTLRRRSVPGENEEEVRETAADESGPKTMAANRPASGADITR